MAKGIEWVGDQGTITLRRTDLSDLNSGTHDYFEFVAAVGGEQEQRSTTLQTLTGASGDDLLRGGKGDDIFVYKGTGDDTITDFNTGDTIRLEGIDGISAFADLVITQTDGGFTIAFGDDTLTIMTDLESLGAGTSTSYDAVRAQCATP